MSLGVQLQAWPVRPARRRDITALTLLQGTAVIPPKTVITRESG
jgi:hypothetical protein